MTALLSKLLHENANKIKSRFRSKDIEDQLRILPPEISAKLPPLRTTQKASILVPLIDNGRGSSNDFQNLSIIFTKRAKNMNHHPNEIAFAGGHYDPSLDGNSLINTALREAREELIPPIEKFNIFDDSNKFVDERYDFWKNLIILGQTETIPSAKLVPVTPYFAYFRHQIPNAEDLFPGNADEVSKVFALSLQELIDIEKTRRLKRLGMEGPVYPTEHGDIWGLTALVLKPILHEVLKPVFTKGNL